MFTPIHETFSSIPISGCSNGHNVSLLVEMVCHRIGWLN
jgi:hypothetical protein